MTRLWKTDRRETYPLSEEDRRSVNGNLTQKDIIPKVDAPLQVYDMPGFQDLDPEDFVIPRIRLIQPTSKLDGSEGHFNNSATNQALSSFDVVLLRITKSRVLWSSTMGEDPLCASNDAVLQRPEFESSTYGPYCTECPQAKWGTDGEVPPCKLTYNLFLVDTETQMPAILSCAGTAVGEAKNLFTTLRFLRKPMYEALVNVTSKEKSGPRGRWYIPVFTVKGPVDDSGFYSSLYNQFVGVDIEADTEA